ncbi:peptidoglycan D,D-transpeptidase FtsI family protein [Desulfofalx alkaliphila]|uniref:peptidoglycan D,D-transpeptidase FtsI family protein n=1 Tax=Desulfofalx alkaliphila TaxID=105483 RepID=UPI0004E0DB6D|nr:penicillin-binding transpeptidase domain-containing protein [Desulfofalx alkaliphila]
MKNNIRNLGIFILLLLTILIFYLSYIHLKMGSELASHPNNRRMAEQMANIHRGSIYDRKGVVLAESRWVDEGSVRVYPRGAETANIIGYTSKKYGASGLESTYDIELLGMNREEKLFNEIRKATGQSQLGQDLVLTLDAELQHLAVELLGGKRGAVVAVDPRTGAILAAATSPSFDPNNLEQEWEHLQNNKDAPLLNRAFQGAYPPGSVMKLITAAGALAQGHQGGDLVNCPGYLMVEGFKLEDNVHGHVDLTEALVVSCNTAFGQLALEMGRQPFVQVAEQFGFNTDFALGVESRPSTMGDIENMDSRQLAVTAIGQGDLLVSPLHMAMVAAAVANGGSMMQPYLVQEVRNSLGKTSYQHRPGLMLQATDAETARIIGDAMAAAVERGTARAAAIGGIEVAGKTGTAENPHGASHAWFVGFAPVQQPRVAVSVIIENGGSGGRVAAPIAQKVISEALMR